SSAVRLPARDVVAARIGAPTRFRELRPERDPVHQPRECSSEQADDQGPRIPFQTDPGQVHGQHYSPYASSRGCPPDRDDRRDLGAAGAPEAPIVHDIPPPLFGEVLVATRT